MPLLNFSIRAFAYILVSNHRLNCALSEAV